MNGIERVSSDDLMSLATDRGTVPLQIGAVIVLDTSNGCDTAALIAEIESRLPAVPRLRQHLVSPGFPFGGPFWVDVEDFDIARHVSVETCPADQGRQGLLDVAAHQLMVRLPKDRPLWAARIITDVAPGTTGVVLTLHHVLADGLGALSILAALTSTGELHSAGESPRHTPARTKLFLDAVRRHLGSLAQAPRAVRRVTMAFSELVRGRTARAARAPRSSLNRPIGRTGLQLLTVSDDVADLATVAHAHYATINDVVLAAITGALRSLLDRRGEQASEFVISVPFSSRGDSQSTSLGNRSGVIPLALPSDGDAAHRILAIADITAAAKRAPRGATTAILGPMFRALAVLGVYQRFVDGQRFVNTFVTNVRGPEAQVMLGGSPILELIPLTTAMGNITVSFAVLSYAGRLTVTIVADRSTCPDAEALRVALEAELDRLHAPATLVDAPPAGP